MKLLLALLLLSSFTVVSEFEVDNGMIVFIENETGRQHVIKQIKNRTSAKNDIVNILIEYDFWREYLRQENQAVYASIAAEIYENDFAMVAALQNQYKVETEIWFDANRAALVADGTL